MGLGKHDLHDMVDKIFEIDSFKSKMGEDKDIVTLSFSVRDTLAAEDLKTLLKKVMHLYLMLIIHLVNKAMVHIKCLLN